MTASQIPLCIGAGQHTYDTYNIRGDGHEHVGTGMSAVFFCVKPMQFQSIEIEREREREA